MRGSGLLRPIVQNVQPGSASLVFHAHDALDFDVEWRAPQHDPSWRPARMKRHALSARLADSGQEISTVTARLEGLPAGALIQCRASAHGVSMGGPWTVRIPAPNSLDGEVLVVGDTGHVCWEQQAVLRQMMAVPDPELVVHTGDLAYPVANPDSLREHYFDPYAPLMSSVPFYPVLGNHDTPADQGAAVIAMHDLPEARGVLAEHEGRYYSLVRGPVHFIFLDSNEPLWEPAETNHMLRWVRSELENSRSFWRVVVIHHTPYPAGRHKNDYGSSLVRENLMPILQEFEVPLLLAGHEHLYKRTAAPARGSRGTLVVTTGGGGGGLYPAELTEPNVFARSIHHFVRIRFQGASLSLQAVDLYGETIDQALLAPPPAIRSFSWRPGESFQIHGAHLGLPRHRFATDLELNGHHFKVARVTPTAIEVPWPQTVPPLGDLRLRTPNGEQTVPIPPDYPWQEAGPSV